MGQVFCRDRFASGPALILDGLTGLRELGRRRTPSSLVVGRRSSGILRPWSGDAVRQHGGPLPDLLQLLAARCLQVEHEVAHQDD